MHDGASGRGDDGRGALQNDDGAGAPHCRTRAIDQGTRDFAEQGFELARVRCQDDGVGPPGKRVRVEQVQRVAIDDQCVIVGGD